MDDLPRPARQVGPTRSNRIADALRDQETMR